MNRLIGWVGCLVLGFGFVSSAVAVETLDEVSAKIAAASKKIESYSAKSKTVTIMKQEGFSMVSTVEGTTETLHKGDKTLVRVESSSITETTVAGNTTKLESTMTMISDGTYAYTVSENAGMKTAYKTNVEDSSTDPFKAWRATSELKVLPDSSVDGHAVWVIEATPKGGPGMQGKTVMSFHKETGQMIKMIAYTPDGKPMTTTTYSDIKINPKISPDRFVFKAPAGVTVKDMTK